MRVLTWNIQWKKAASRSGSEIKKILADLDPDIVCLTETYDDFFEHGYTISSHFDYGYAAPTGRRKVVLWSKTPWYDTDPIGDTTLPTGRFVAGKTEHNAKIYHVMGVCVPWRAAHVSTGRKDRRPWEDHETYLDGLSSYLKEMPKANTVLMGDFNQSIPRNRQPETLFSKLSATTQAYARVDNALQDAAWVGLIDHIFLSTDLHYNNCQVIPSHHESLQLSDHHGLFVDLQPLPAPNGRWAECALNKPNDLL